MPMGKWRFGMLVSAVFLLVVFIQFSIMSIYLDKPLDIRLPIHAGYTYETLSQFMDKDGALTVILIPVGEGKNFNAEPVTATFYPNVLENKERKLITSLPSNFLVHTTFWAGGKFIGVIISPTHKEAA